MRYAPTIIVLSLMMGCREESTENLPTVTTIDVIAITTTTATIRAVVDFEGGLVVFEHGLLYSDVAASGETRAKDVSAGIGAYQIELNALKPGTKYSARAYAQNSKGIAYGMAIPFETNKVDPKRVQLDLLVGGWNFVSVTRDGADQPEYESFHLSLSETNNMELYYTSQGRPTVSPWESGGLMEFGANPETTLVKDPNTSASLNMSYSFTGSNLKLEFRHSGPGLAGAWVFLLREN